MKKLIALLLAFTLLLSCNIAFAANTPSLDFLQGIASITNMEQNGTISFKLNKPFEMLNLMPEESVYVDMAMLFESLADSTLTVSSKTKITDDGKKQLTEAHIKSDVSYKANNNLEGNVKTNFSTWLEFDATDAGNPFFDAIVASPFASKYVTVNSDLILENGEATPEEIANVCTILTDRNARPELENALIASMEKNAIISGNSKRIKIAFSDTGLKKFIADLFTAVANETGEDLFANDYEDDALAETLKTVPVFGNDALVLDYTLDSKNRIKSEKTTLHIDCNIYDFLVTMTGDMPPAESGITREKCEMDFTITGQATYQYGAVDIKKPVLTEENSMDIFEYEDPYYYEYPDDYEDYEDGFPTDYYEPWAYGEFDGNCFEGGQVKYVGLRSFLEGIGYSVYYDNGTIRAELNSKFAKYKAFCFVVGSDVAYTDLHDVTLKTPLFVKDGVTYISIDDCENLTNYKRESLSYNFGNRRGYISFSDFTSYPY